jgi:uncharacterized membrane protein YedE/YeeE
MSVEPFIKPIVGGALIGLSASLLLLFQGRVFGISGVVSGILFPKKGDTAWRICVILGFLIAGLVFKFTSPDSLAGETASSWSRYVLAGLLVGIGTQLGSGCTSGHGVCGISRLSPRSIVATVTFMATGILTVWILRWMGGRP